MSQSSSDSEGPSEVQRDEDKSNRAMALGHRGRGRGGGGGDSRGRSRGRGGRVANSSDGDDNTAEDSAISIRQLAMTDVSVNDAVPVPEEEKGARRWGGKGRRGPLLAPEGNTRGKAVMTPAPTRQDASVGTEGESRGGFLSGVANFFGRGSTTSTAAALSSNKNNRKSKSITAHNYNNNFNDTSDDEPVLRQQPCAAYMPNTEIEENFANERFQNSRAWEGICLLYGGRKKAQEAPKSNTELRKDNGVKGQEGGAHLLEVGVILTDVMSFLPLEDLVELLATCSAVHEWYDTCVEFRMAIAYTDAPWYDEKKEAREREKNGGKAQVAFAVNVYNGNSGSSCISETPRTVQSNVGHNFVSDEFRRELYPHTRPRWRYAPIGFEQHSAGYLQADEMAPTQLVAMRLVPEVSYFNLRSLCCSGMISRKAYSEMTRGAPNVNFHKRGGADLLGSVGVGENEVDYYDATVSLDAGEYLLAGLVARKVVIKSTGGIAKIGKGFLRSTTATHVTIAADRYSGAMVVAPRSIGGGWLGDCPYLTSLDCRGLDHCSEVGSRWLERNNMLESVSFTGLKSLTTVGESWLNSCRKLVHVDFSGLKKLRTVDGWWMRECSALEEVDLKGLDSLVSPGSRWLEKCDNLKMVKIDGLNSAAIRNISNSYEFKKLPGIGRESSSQ